MKIRVVVVDDSLFMRTFITRILQEDPDVEVVATGSNGLEGVELVKQLRPHVVTMDIDMPVMNGIDAVRRIMDECPTPVVMLSALSKKGADATIQALQYGAVDFLEKPTDIPKKIVQTKEKLLAKIKVAANVSIYQSKSTTLGETPIKTKGPLWVSPRIVRQIVAIGTSTGGPRALEVVLSALPKDFPSPIVIVQHMPATFTRSLADRLNHISRIRVKEAVDGEILVPGTAYIAPGGWHMEVVQRFHNLQIHLHQGPKRHEHRPSVDVLFESLAKLTSIEKLLVLMTGMGNDGVQGMQLVKQGSGATTIAESEETCVVFGMPKAAIESNCVDYVLPLHQIAEKIIELIPGTERSKALQL